MDEYKTAVEEEVVLGVGRGAVGSEGIAETRWVFGGGGDGGNGGSGGCCIGEVTGTEGKHCVSGSSEKGAEWVWGIGKWLKQLTRHGSCTLYGVPMVRCTPGPLTTCPADASSTTPGPPHAIPAVISPLN